MLKKLQKLLKNPYILITIVVVVVLLYLKKKESFSKLPRYFYMYTPSSRNSSYDQRAEPIFHIKDTTKTGIYYESSLDKNQTNQRVADYYDQIKFDVGDDNDQHKILAYSKM